MKLSDVRVGTPIRIKAFEAGKQVVDIWGKVRSNAGKERVIEIFYYEGMNVNFNHPRYETKAYIFTKGGKEQEVSLNKAKISGGSVDIAEKRDSFRIFVSTVADCKIYDKSTAALVVDMSMGGFRISINEGGIPNESPVSIHIQDEGLDFRLYGHTIWSRPDGKSRHYYGCQINPGEDKEELGKYLQLKQQHLYKQLMSEIKS